ncbi:MAG: ATPase [Rhodothermales bacterium]|nr:ATPase [Rhodothermales bacterium]
MDKGMYQRRDRLVQEKHHDVYRNQEKWPESTQCSSCKAIFVNGRWSWASSDEVLHNVVCPACQRIADKYPAGVIEITGPFFSEHRDEIENLFHNLEKKENAEHPLERIMAISDEDDKTIVSTTGIHLARRIGKALASAYEGSLSMRYGDDEQSVQLSWER